MTSAGSPAINSGLDLNNLFAVNTGSVYFFGSVLPASNGRDIGAYEKPSVIITAIANENISYEKITFYPNPLTNGETLHFEGGAPYALELYSIGGSLLIKEAGLDSDYYISQSMIGIYIIRITDNKGKVKTGKLIIR